MSETQRFQRIVLKVNAPSRLDFFLRERLVSAVKGGPQGSQWIRRLIVGGQVLVDRKKVRQAAIELKSGAEVQVYLTGKNQVELAQLKSESVFQQSVKQAPEAIISILYEDQDVLLVNKPAGIPTQPTMDPHRPSLWSEVKKILVRREGGDPYLGLHHRLDRDTSGVVLFTRLERANSGVAALFREHRIQKKYRAVCWVGKEKVGQRPFELKTGQEGRVVNYLGKLESRQAGGAGSRPGKEISRFGSVRSGGDFAETLFVVKEVGAAVVLDAYPKTGRTHQIRVHCSEMGLPIIGDPVYGDRVRDEKAGNPRLLLHAVSLTFQHPITNVEMTVEAPLPEDFVKCLDRLLLSKNL